MATPWEYHVSTLRTSDDPLREEGAWIPIIEPELERLGDEGWESVLVLRREENYVHVLFKRPKMPARPRAAPVAPVGIPREPGDPFGPGYPLG